MQTRDALLQSGMRTMLVKGYQGSSLSEVLKDASIPKGSFYHFFESKHNFGLNIMEHYVSENDDVFFASLQQQGLPPIQRLRGYFESCVLRLENAEYSGGCLIGNIGQEMSDEDKTLSETAEGIFIFWRDKFVPCLEEAQSRNELSDLYDPKDLSDFLWNSWEGAILRMKTSKSGRPLRIYIDYVFNTILLP